MAKVFYVINIIIINNVMERKEHDIWGYFHVKNIEILSLMSCKMSINYTEID